MATSPTAHPDYPLIIRRRDDGVVLVCPALGLIEEGKHLDETLTAMEAQQQSLLARYGELGLTPPDPVSAAGGQVKGFSWMRTGIVASLVVVGFIALTAPVYLVAMKAQNAMVTLRQSMESEQTIRHAGQALERLADLAGRVTPERQEELAGALRALSVALEPYAAELRPLFLGPEQSLVPGRGHGDSVGDSGGDAGHPSAPDPVTAGGR